MKPSSMPDIAGAFRIRREMRKRKQDTNRVSTNTNRVSCKDCQWWDPDAESYACSACPVTDDTANAEHQARCQASPECSCSAGGRHGRK